MARHNLQANAVSPPAPAPGFCSIYFKTDNVLYIKDSSGVETPIGTASGITQLTGDVTATGPGTVPATVVSVGGASAADIGTAVAAYLAATPNATPSTLALRDGAGVFKTTTPTDPAHVANKAYVDNKVLTIPVAHGIANIAGVIQAIFGSTADTIVEGNDARLSIANVVRVKKNPGAGEFLTLEDAMASITTNSITNPFVIEWGPGVYTINNSSGPIVIKPYVFIRGDSQYSVIAQPQDPLQDLFLVNNSESGLRDIIIQNVTGPSASAIRVTRSDVPFLIDHVKTINCTQSLVLEATSFPVEVAARSFRAVSGPDTIRFCSIVSSLGQQSTLRIYTSLMTEDDGTSFEDGFFIEGTGARLDTNTLLLRSTTGAGNGIRLSNGGEFVSQSGSEIEGFDQNFWIENSGVAPIIRTTVIMLRNGITWDLNVAHPGAKGSIMAKANTSTGVFVNPSSPVKLVLTDPSSTDTIGLFIKGDLYQADRFDRRANLSLLAREDTTLGLVEGSGGVISIVSGLQINVSAGYGFLEDPTDDYLKQVAWSSTNFTLAANTEYFVYADTNSIVQVNSVLPSLETVIPLGRVVTRSSSIDFIEHSQLVMSHIGNRIEALLRDGLGSIFGTGATVTENATPRRLDVTAGSYNYGTNLMMIAGGSAISWESIYRDGSGDFIYGTQSTADNAFYDDGSGTLAPIPSGDYAKHTLYVLGDSGSEKYFLVYSQNTSSSLATIESEPLPLVPSFLTDAVVRIAGIIVKQGQSNLQEVLDIRPRLGFAAPSSTNATDHGNLTGLLDDDHPQYLIRTGIRPMTGIFTSTNTTQSTDKDTGSIVTEGGLGVEKNINAGGTVLGSNLSGTNTGNVTLQPVGSSPNANGATLGGGTGQDLTLQPADNTNPGLLTAIAQSIGGIKTFLAKLLVSDTTQSTDKDTGSIVTEGGLGVEKNINAGGNIASVGTLSGSNFSGSSSGSNTGDVSVTDTNSIDLTLAGQNVSADLKLSADAADAGNIKITNSIHSNGLHSEIPYDVPVNIGTTNAVGTGGKTASFDHVHAITFTVVGGLVMSTYVLGTNVAIAATDTIVAAFGKIQAQINAIVGYAVSSLTGDVTGTGPGATATTIAVGAVTDTKASLANKPAVTVVATTNQTLSGTPTIDGQATVAGTSIVLLSAQTTASQNGPWVVQSGAWTRPSWYPSGGTTQAFQFITTFVRLGTVYQGSVWRQTAAAPITIDTTATTWVVTPLSGNYKTLFTVGPQSGSSQVELAFSNAFTGKIAWNPSSSFQLLLPPTQGAAGTFLSNDGSGNLSWTNPVVNIDGGTPTSVYTSGQFINGGTP